MSAGRVGVLVQPSRPSGSAVLDDVHPRYQHADELLVRERHFAAVARANMGHRDSHGARQLRGVLATVANGVAAAACPGHHSVDHKCASIGQPEVAFARAGALVRFDSKSVRPIVSWRNSGSSRLPIRRLKVSRHTDDRNRWSAGLDR